MNKILYIIFILITNLLFSDECERLDAPEIYYDISKIKLGMDITFLKIQKSSLITLYTPSHLLPYFYIISDKVKYQIIYDDNNIVRSIRIENLSYTQSLFHTPEGIYVNMTYHELMLCMLTKDITQSNTKIYKVGDWCYLSYLFIRIYDTLCDMSYDELKKKTKLEKLIHYRGFSGYGIELKSGWLVLFLQKTYPDNDDVISILIKQ
jgi:hypothetical protein